MAVTEADRVRELDDEGQALREVGGLLLPQDKPSDASVGSFMQKIITTKFCDNVNYEPILACCYVHDMSNRARGIWKEGGATANPRIFVFSKRTGRRD